jgi:hypothetical protein
MPKMSHSIFRSTSLVDQLGVLELAIWDKDVLKEEYLGEVSLLFEGWFADKHGGKLER